MTLTKSEWLERYALELMAVAHLTREEADERAAEGDWAGTTKYSDDDPEGAARDEISYWD